MKKISSNVLEIPLPEEEFEFLQQSNWIEREFSPEALHDAIDAWECLKEWGELTENAILFTHGMMTARLLPQHESGKYRTIDVLIGGKKASPPYALWSLMENWLQMYGKASTEEAIKQAHVAFEAIHPFVDGNGRIGRMIMNYQRIKTGLPILIIHTGKEQMDYYQWFK